MGLFVELFLFLSVRASTKADELWPEHMRERNWSTKGEDSDDGDDGSVLSARQGQN